MLALAYRNLRARPARTFFTALAIALGVGMIFAMRIVSVTLAQTANEARAGRLAGADLEISSASSSNLSDTLADTLAARPEVEAAAPIYRGQEGRLDPSATASAANALIGAQLKGTGLALLGVDPARALTPYELAAGSFFSAPDAAEVLLPTTWATLNGVGVGGQVSLTTGQRTRDYSVVGLLKGGTLTGKPTAWLPLKTLQSAFDQPGAASTVLVRLKPGYLPDPARDQIQQELGAPYIVTSAAGGSSVRPFLSILTDSALPFSALAVLLTGSFLVYNAFAITLAERRREISQLRTLGMTRRQVRRQALSEALLIALLGSALGLLLGLLLGPGVVALFSGLLQGRSAPAIPWPLDGALLALGAGMLVTLAVTLNLARQAGSVSPLEGLRADSARQASQSWYMRWGWAGALVCLALFLAGYIAITRGLVELPYESGMGPIFILPFALSAVALFALPVVVRGALWLFERLARRMGVAARLAAGSIARQPGRAVLTTATLLIGLMLVVGLSGILSVFRAMQNQSILSLFEAEFMFIRPIPGISLEQAVASPSLPPLPPALQADLDDLARDAQVLYMANIALPGYSAGGGIDNAFAASLDLVRDKPDFGLKEGSWAEADQYFAQGPALTVPEYTARRLKLHPGDIVQIDTVEGKVPFKVALIGGPVPYLSSEDGARYFHSYPFVFLVNTRPGDDKAALEVRLEALARKHTLVFSADPLDTFNRLSDTVFNSVLGLFTGLTSLSSIVAAFGIVNTLVASVLERQRELGMLRALGMSRAQVRWLVVAEAGVLGLTGAVLGVLAGLAITLAFAGLISYVMREFGVQSLQGVPLPWAVMGAALVSGPLISMLAALYPADRAANVNPTEAMRAEGAAGFLKPAAHLGPTGVRGLIARMPLAAKLSIVLSLVFILTTTALTAVRVRYERQLLEDNVKALAERQMDLAVEVGREQFMLDITALTPQTIKQVQDQMRTQSNVLRDQFQGGRSPYEFGVKYVIVGDTNNKVVTSDKAEYIGRVLTDVSAPSGGRSTVRTTDWTGERAFEATLPLQNRSGKRLGYLLVGFSTEPVDNLIRDIVRSSLWAMLAALAAAVILTLLFTRRALSPLSLLLELSRAVARGDLSRRIPEDRWDEIGRLAQAFNEMVRGLSERERLRDLFGRYLSRSVSEVVLAGRVTLEGERKDVTVLFCDVRGSTAFAEAHPPEEVMAALNQYFEEIIRATEAYGGVVNGFLGDGALCVFGAPIDRRDHADCAVRAALRMRGGLDALSQRRAAAGLPTLKFGIGLNSGAVIAGATGSEERQEYTVIGDAVNLGARIGDLNKIYPEHDILLSEFTRAALGAQAEQHTFADLGEIQIRGKSQVVRVFGLIT